ncbi:MAG: hypothetical protein F6K48_05825 [Okeania sp. SIO3H1]|nr:hypothetical protein [Okeania sp. SIO3H1]
MKIHSQYIPEYIDTFLRFPNAPPHIKYLNDERCQRKNLKQLKLTQKGEKIHVKQ